MTLLTGVARANICMLQLLNTSMIMVLADRCKLPQTANGSKVYMQLMNSTLLPLPSRPEDRGGLKSLWQSFYLIYIHLCIQCMRPNSQLLHYLGRKLLIIIFNHEFMLLAERRVLHFVLCCDAFNETRELMGILGDQSTAAWNSRPLL